MGPVQNRDQGELSAGGRGIHYLLMLARYPQRSFEPPARTYAKALGRALRRMGVVIAGKRKEGESSDS